MFSPAIKGSAIAIVLIAFNLVLYLTGQTQNQALSLIPLGILAISIVCSCIIYTKQSTNTLGFGDVFAESFKVSAAITCLMCVYTFISIKFIMTDLLDLTIAQAKKEMVEKGVSISQMDSTIGMLKQFFIPMKVGSVLFSQLFLGTVFSLLAAALVPKIPKPSQEG